MKQLIYVTAISLITGWVYAGDKSGTVNSNLNRGEIIFTENKGQFHDQNYNPRPDVLYGVQAGNMSVHIKNSGVSYQLYKVDSWKEVEDSKTNKKRKVIEKQSIYRVDISWINANVNITNNHDEVLSGHSNYYLENCPMGAFDVKSYKGVTIGDLYNGISLHYYEKNGELKHDYVIAPHSDYKQIQLHVEGAFVKINSDGTLLFITPLGKIQEGAPIVYQKGKQLKAKWLLHKNNLSFEIENYNPSLELIIDPVTRLWGTYYGGNNVDVGFACATDASGNVYMAGSSTSNAGTIIATTGAHQITQAGGYDAFIAKFNSSGTRVWSTYYGGSGNEDGLGCSVDPSGNVFLTGGTVSSAPNVIATAGSHQSAFGGGSDPDAFLVKFNSSGVRQWGTYYGGTSLDRASSCFADALGNVYIAGQTSTSTSTVIATSGIHQSTFGGGISDAFIAKFNSAGVRQWGTYYGGVGIEEASCCVVDGFGNIYISGRSTTNAGTSIASTGSHQDIHGGGNDAYLAKFSNNGMRQWGTYYGGSNTDIGRGCAVDTSGGVYLIGYTASNTGTVIATAGSHQSAHGGGNDAFVVKFNSLGIRQWGTYYGGTGGDLGHTCATDQSGNLYLAGETASNTGTIIATPGSHQPVYGGGTEDSFVTKFSGAGLRQWGTYYSGTNGDYIYSCSTNTGGNIFVAGEALSNTGTAIASAGSHQSVYGGGINDAFLAKLYDCTPNNPVNTTPINNLTICTGQSTTLSATSGTNSINWFASPTSTTVISSGTSFTTPVLSAGTYTYFVEANGCVVSQSRTAITVTVNSNPSVTVNSGAICLGSSFTIVPSGASTYTIQGGSAVISPTTTTSFTVIGTSSAGCVSSSPAVSNVTVNPLPTITASSSNTMLCVGQSATITANGASSYTFNPGGAATSVVVSPTITTTYSITGTNAAGCTNTSTFTQSVSICASINQFLNSNLRFAIYPNPTTGLIKVNANQLIGLISIYNTLGQLVYSENINNTNAEIDISHLNNGIYIGNINNRQIRIVISK